MSLLEELRELLGRRVVHLGTLAALLIAVGAETFLIKFSVLDLDIWWHLKVGEWIVEHHRVPHTGILSRTAANLPWMAYSWGYEVLLAAFYSALGLFGLAVFGSLLTLALAIVIYWMIRRLAGSFWPAFLLTLIACFPVLFSIMPRPVFFSEILFCIILTLLLEANRTGYMRTLYWLPLIFFVWANLHIQFVYGLLAVGIFVAAHILRQWFSRLGIANNLLPSKLPARSLLAILFACGVATCIGPYSFHLYRVIVEYSHAKFAYSRILEMQAINFRAPENYVQLLLTAAGFFIVGRQRKVDLFKMTLLTMCAGIAYRTTRDTWFICLPAAAFIADYLGLEQTPAERPENALEWGAIAAVVCLGLVLVAPTTDFNERALDRAVSANFPVDAVNFVRKNPVPGPLYNDLNWGGFLIWYMPDFPVAIDGRNDLYGDELDQHFDKLEGGDPSYASDPTLNQSGVILLNRKLPLARRLQLDSRYRVLYQDGLAVVFRHE